MDRKLILFYIPATVRNITDYAWSKTSIDQKEVTSGVVMLGIRLQNTVLMSNNFYEKIGFKTPTYIENLIVGLNPTPTVITFSDQSDAMRAGIVKRVNFTLKSIPAAGATAPTKSVEVKTYVVYPATLSDYAIAQALIDHTFLLDSDNYKVIPRSLKPFKSKATTPTYSGFGPPPPDFPDPTKPPGPTPPATGSGTGTGTGP